MSRTYVVFARRESKEALTRVGSVEAENEEGAADAARREHGEDWLEMVAIPEEEMSWAIGGE